MEWNGVKKARTESSARATQDTKMINNFQYEPDVLSPGLAVNLATSTIFTANCIFDSRCTHLRTIENGPLQRKKVRIFH